MPNVLYIIFNLLVEVYNFHVLAILFIYTMGFHFVNSNKLAQILYRMS